MTEWQKSFTREPTKTKTELREMLAEAVRNTQPEAKRLPKSKIDRGLANLVRFPRMERCKMNDVPTLETSCTNCFTPGSLSATLAVILIGAGIALTAEWRKLAHVRSDK